MSRFGVVGGINWCLRVYMSLPVQVASVQDAFMDRKVTGCDMRHDVVAKGDA